MGSTRSGGAVGYADIGVAISGTGFIGPAQLEPLRRLGGGVEGISGSSLDPHFFPTFAQGHNGILLCGAILRSNKEERWVILGQ
jgi:hypothetical protein